MKIDNAAKMERIIESFNDEFCGRLEFHLCRTLKNSKELELQGFWCDGVFSATYLDPKLNRRLLSKQHVIDTGEIEANAYMGKMVRTFIT